MGYIMADAPGGKEVAWASTHTSTAKVFTWANGCILGPKASLIDLLSQTCWESNVIQWMKDYEMNLLWFSGFSLFKVSMKSAICFLFFGPSPDKIFLSLSTGVLFPKTNLYDWPVKFFLFCLYFTTFTTSLYNKNKLSHFFHFCISQQCRALFNGRVTASGLINVYRYIVYRVFLVINIDKTFYLGVKHKKIHKV